MEGIRVRAAEERDLEAIAEIFRCPGVIHGTLQLPYRSIEDWRERLARRSPDRHPLVAELDGRVVGMLTLYRQQADRRHHAGSLGMAVHDDYQGRGIGTALMAAAIELADRWLGLHRLELQVYTDNQRAIRLYERFGFVIEGTLRDFALRDGRYVDAYAMARIRPDV